MFVSIAGIAHDVSGSGPVMLFVNKSGRINAGQSGCAVVADKGFEPVLVDGLPQLPQKIMDHKKASGWMPASLASVEAAHVKAFVAGGGSERDARLDWLKVCPGGIAPKAPAPKSGKVEV